MSGLARRVRGPSLALICLLVCASAASAKSHPSYHSPGYRGTHKVPHVAPLPPPPPIVLGPGEYPHVLVDAAGTGHIAWSSQVNDQDAVLHYCQLRRGQKACSVQSSMVPPDADANYGNSPGTDEDFDGPFPLAIGNELLLLDHRCCNMVPLPDGNSSYDVNFLYTSADGGKTITGPGIIGTQNPGTDTSNVGIFGGDNPQIGVISDTQTGGTFFQGTSAGAFTESEANLGDLGPDEAYDGRIATDGIRPVVAFADLTNHIFVREYKRHRRRQQCEQLVVVGDQRPEPADRRGTGRRVARLPDRTGLAVAAAARGRRRGERKGEPDHTERRGRRPVPALRGSAWRADRGVARSERVTRARHDQSRRRTAPPGGPSRWSPRAT